MTGARPVALTIAGLDPTGGAGIAADLRTFERFGVHGTAVVSVLTVQSARGVLGVEPVAAKLLSAQLATLLDDQPVRAAKTGALGTAALVEVVAEALAGRPAIALVIDPVVHPTAGVPLFDADGARALVERLLPRARVVTPNAPELAWLTGRRVDDGDSLREAARALADRAGCAVLAKAGHLGGEPVDVLVDGGTVVELPGARVRLDRPVHGTGCVLSAAITAGLARGSGLAEACAQAKAHVAGWLVQERVCH